MKARKIVVGFLLFLALVLAEWATAEKILGLFFYNRAREKGDDLKQYKNFLLLALKYDASYGLITHTLAKALMWEKKYFEARDWVQKGLKSFTSLGAFKQLGSIYLNLSDPLRAEEYFRRVLLMDPSDQDSLERLAMIAIYRRDFKAAQSYILALERYHPDNPNLFYIEGFYNEYKGDLWQALLSYQMALYVPQPKKGKWQLIFTKDDLQKKVNSLEMALRKRLSRKR